MPTLNRKLPPGPKARIFGATLFPFRRNPLKFMSELAARYGDIVFFRSGTERFFLINHPDYVKDMEAITHDYVLMGLDLKTDEEYAGMG